MSCCTGQKEAAKKRAAKAKRAKEKKDAAATKGKHALDSDTQKDAKPCFVYQECCPHLWSKSRKHQYPWLYRLWIKKNLPNAEIYAPYIALFVYEVISDDKFRAHREARITYARMYHQHGLTTADIVSTLSLKLPCSYVRIINNRLRVKQISWICWGCDFVNQNGLYVRCQICKRRRAGKDGVYSTPALDTMTSEVQYHKRHNCSYQDADRFFWVDCVRIASNPFPLRVCLQRLL